MTRILLFALSLLLFSCGQVEPPTDKQAPAPAVQLTASQEETPGPAPENEPAAPESNPAKQKVAAETDEGKPVPAPLPAARLKTADKPQSNVGQPAEAAGATNRETTSKEADAPPSHEKWNALLQQYVSANGKVNYQGFLADKGSLQAYLDELAAHPPTDSWPRNERLAYWINTYNAYTVKLIVDNYPVSSITELHSGKPWDVKWIELGEKTYSLNQIENDIIRPRFGEPRIHFAVNCAAVSCPPLLNRAYTADKLNLLLEQQARQFINNDKYNKISPQGVKVSRIFDWYAEDFGNIIDYLSSYSETKINPDAKVTYMEYDWALNGQ